MSKKLLQSDAIANPTGFSTGTCLITSMRRLSSRFLLNTSLQKLVSLRVSELLRRAIRAVSRRRGIWYRRFIWEALEVALTRGEVNDVQ